MPMYLIDKKPNTINRIQEMTFHNWVLVNAKIYNEDSDIILFRRQEINN